MPYSVFLVEDEIVAREGIRDNVDWQVNGFVFCGEVSDGELALPQVEGADAVADPGDSADSEPTLELAYDFTLETLDGETVTLSDFQGDWVLVNFWATWCPLCVREMPYLQEIAETRDIHVLGINMGESEGQVRRFVEEHGITFPILMQADQLLTIAYNARSLPQTYVIAPDGTVALRVVGAVESGAF